MSNENESKDLSLREVLEMIDQAYQEGYAAGLRVAWP